MNDSIVDEIRRIRKDYAKRFGYDLKAMAADLREKEETHREQLVSFPPKPVRRIKTEQGANLPDSRRRSHSRKN